MATMVSDLGNFCHFTPSEMEFNAECVDIEIIPNFSLPRLQLLEGDYGPFRPSMRMTVPLWVARFLKRRKRCQIAIPEWLKLDKLEELLDEERRDEHVFKELPYHYYEISSVLFQEAKDDFGGDLHMVREKVRDIHSVRRNKIHTGLSKLRSSAPVELANIAGAEVCLIQPFMQSTLYRFYRHEQAAQAAKESAAKAAESRAQEMAAAAQARRRA
mmetsp:Transcript_39866/g.66870  ORF Transcript_39866/g.66870 Transcript_39866/m.66870 type:complete len:215 (-) Transcript_39866:98-742(-)|eukprot:CAMPEP_0198199176 /NCGR_PEP_ID=MMETSP1445-20131203/2504_1 /TAXON_ID=36898 /ORGANISM="Pyramimonas sp., Strain CCMP2087" /LENGTH=214 /DNA_ID=CAMNT_0043868937 /DNA_START=370 /DNA_END=1014 /DNA_ORIENTATION=+